MFSNNLFKRVLHLVCTGCEEVLVVVGGFGHQQSPIDAVEKFDPKLGEWVSLPVSIYYKLILLTRFTFILAVKCFGI